MTIDTVADILGATATLAQSAEPAHLVPVCAWCKQVRNRDGEWEEIGSYLEAHPGARFTHSVCPRCARQLRDDNAI
ncbi:MAG: hypothetical protein U1G07_21300 [Verrucomicrobiota bacterium]